MWDDTALSESALESADIFSIGNFVKFATLYYNLNLALPPPLAINSPKTPKGIASSPVAWSRVETAVIAVS